MKNRGILVVFSGFSGSGKGTIMKKLIENHSDIYALSVSATTRNPREGERDGIEYFFKTVPEFEELIKNNMMLEYANYAGNYYGTPKEYVEKKLDEGYDVILEIETQGALKVKAQYPDTLLMFVTPPSADILYERLKGRGTETDEVIAKRMNQANVEAKVIDQYDYLVINDDIDECVTRVHEIIKNTHDRTVFRADTIEALKTGLNKYQRRD
ncbi:MAG: guanylate kinase [Lachnospiraceae bacterium]|nr:guanylate kinase [Lachnospiraceae bacterium]MBR5788722.1 guanylate kinase [Lachnospiraceae bacterium]